MCGRSASHEGQPPREMGAGARPRLRKSDLRMATETDGLLCKPVGEDQLAELFALVTDRRLSRAFWNLSALGRTSIGLQSQKRHSRRTSDP